jgi:hypothetical protein
MSLKKTSLLKIIGFFVLFLAVAILTIVLLSSRVRYAVVTTVKHPPRSIKTEEYVYLPVHPLAESAKKQIGIVTSYDSGYYSGGGYPPEDRGACTDVIERALRENGYDLKTKIDSDMSKNPSNYTHEPDPNINFRRVRNVKTFFDSYEESLPTCTEEHCFAENIWMPGDIVTFDQIPGSLWHIAILSNKTLPYNGNKDVRVPLLIHNYGGGVVEDDMLLRWPAPITGHYRIREILSTNE